MLAALLTVSLVGATAAAASGAATASASQTTGSGSWAALATQQSSAPYLTSALTLTFAAALTTPPPQYFWVVNSGTITLTRAGYTVTETGAVGVTATVQACTGGTWNESTNTCSGSITTVATSGAGATLSTSAPTAGGSKVRLRALLNLPPTLAAALVTVSVAVARTDARAATTTDS
jgi:hypothetical protein